MRWIVFPSAVYTHASLPALPETSPKRVKTASPPGRRSSTDHDGENGFLVASQVIHEILLSLAGMTGEGFV